MAFWKFSTNLWGSTCLFCLISFPLGSSDCIFDWSVFINSSLYHFPFCYWDYSVNLLLDIVYFNSKVYIWFFLIVYMLLRLYVFSFIMSTFAFTSYWPKTNRLRDISPAKVCLFRMSRKLQFRICNHDEPHGREREFFYRRENVVGKAIVNKEFMNFHWLSPC